MNAGLVGWRIRWTHRTFAFSCTWLLAAACAEPATVDPALVPEASIDVAPEAGDAAPDAVTDTATGRGGSGGSGGSGGTGGAGGMAGERSDAGDAGDARDEVADGSADTPMDAAPGDMNVPPDRAADVTGDPISEPPPQDSGGRGDAITDAAVDREGG